MRFLSVACIDRQLEGEKSGEDEEISVYRITSSVKVPVESVVRVPADLVEKKERMRILCKAIKVVVGPSAGI